MSDELFLICKVSIETMWLKVENNVFVDVSWFYNDRESEAITVTHMLQEQKRGMDDLLKTLIESLKCPQPEEPIEYSLNEINTGMTDVPTLLTSQSMEDIITWLAQEMPLEIDGKLIFKPRVGQLPRKSQMAVLSWIIQNPYQLTNSDKVKLIKSYEKSPPSQPWLQQLVRLLDAKTDTGRKNKTLYTFSRQTQAKHAELLDKCRKGGKRRREADEEGESMVKRPLGASQKNISSQDRIVQPDPNMDTSQLDVSLHRSQATQNTTISEGTSVKSQAELPENIRVQAEALVEIWKSSDSSSDIPAQIKCFVECTPPQFELLCEVLGLEELSEISISLACTHLASLGTQLSQQNSVIFAQASLLTRVTSLTQNPSRTLISSVKTLFEAFPQALIDGVLVPSLTQFPSGPPQADVITRIIKEDMTPQNRQYCFSEIVAVQIKWTETIVAVIQTMVDLKTEVEGGLLSDIVERLGQVESLDSPKVAKLILGIIQKYGKKITVAQGSELKLILQKNTSFIRKPALAALNNLKLELKA